MAYSYSIVEAAALWAGVEVGNIQECMNTSDQRALDEKFERDEADAVAEHLIAEERWRKELKACFRCPREFACPEWEEFRTEEGEVYRFKCHEGFHRPPANEPPPRRVVRKKEWTPRLLPHTGEFRDIPKFEERLEWLKKALSRGDLSGTPEEVLAFDLREWMTKHFPGERPGFLFSNTGFLSEVADSVLIDSGLLSEATKLQTQSVSPDGGAGGLRKREQQIRYLVQVAKDLGYEPLQIPEGGKKQIRMLCVPERSRLFTGGEGQFDDIWSDAVKGRQIRTQNHSKYGGKG